VKADDWVGLMLNRLARKRLFWPSRLRGAGLFLYFGVSGGGPLSDAASYRCGFFFEIPPPRIHGRLHNCIHTSPGVSPSRMCVCVCQSRGIRALGPRPPALPSHHLSCVCSLLSRPPQNIFIQLNSPPKSRILCASVFSVST